MVGGRTAKNRQGDRKSAGPPRSKIDYSGFKFAKKGPKAKDKARKDGAKKRTRASVKAQVFKRDRTCRAYGVSPICRRTPWDRHEIIPVGVGGKVTTQNAVAICRADHRACQNGLGGRILMFDWPGKSEGQPPDADRPGHVRAVWKGIWRGVAEQTTHALKTTYRSGPLQSGSTL